MDSELKEKINRAMAAAFEDAKRRGLDMDHALQAVADALINDPDPEVAAFQEQHNRNVRRYLNYGPRGALHGDGKADTMRKFAAELVALAPDVILANPLLQATRTVPIVFTIVADPVGAGYVESLARPGGNITGCGDQPQDR